MNDLIDRQQAIDALKHAEVNFTVQSDIDFSKHRREVQEIVDGVIVAQTKAINELPTAPKREIVRCKDCIHWRQQTNYAGVKLSFGFCESDDMWCSLYGETCEVSHIDTDDDFYCGYAERRTDE